MSDKCHALNMMRESRDRLPATSQLCFCSLILVDYVLILIIWSSKWPFRRSVRSSMLLSLGLVRLISCCYAVPQCIMLYAPQSLSARARFADPVRIPFVLACPVLACITLLSLCSCRATVRILSSLLVGFLVTSVVSFDMLLIIVVL